VCVCFMSVSVSVCVCVCGGEGEVHEAEPPFENVLVPGGFENIQH
jgi:hypothetical protein